MRTSTATRSPYFILGMVVGHSLAGLWTGTGDTVQHVLLLVAGFIGYVAYLYLDSR